MFLHSFGYYLPEKVIPNSYFEPINGLTNDWILTRTGIETRRKASEKENTNTLAIAAVDDLLKNNAQALDDVDLIIGASYTPYDSVATIAHAVQRQFNITQAMAIYISTACSSFINALEIVEGYFATNKSHKALIVNAEHNTAFSHEEDDKSGHLWGDAATAVIVTKKRQNEEDIEVLDLTTHGLAHEGKGTEAVWLKLKTEGLLMPFGKDVFMNACTFMRSAAEDILKKNNLTLADVAYLIPHQANIRIIKHVAHKLKLKTDQVIINVNRLGNTGSASTVLGLAENLDRFKKNDRMVISVFGGGYSSGAALLKK